MSLSHPLPSRSPTLTAGAAAVGSVLVAVAYVVAGLLSFAVAVNDNVVTVVIFAAEGIALAAVLRFGRRLLPGVFMGQLVLALLRSTPVIAAVGISIGNTFEAWVAVCLVARFSVDVDLRTRRDLFALWTMVILVLQPISATLGNLVLVFTDGLAWADFSTSWGTWWFGNMVGQVLLAPLLLAITAPARREGWLELLVLGALCLGLGGAIFWLVPGDHVAVLFLCSVPIVVAAAMFRGLASSSLAVAVLTALALVATHQRIGAFVVDGAPRLVDLNFFTLTLGFAGHFVAVVFGELREQEARLKELAHRAEEASHAKSAFLANMSHELRTPLNSVIGFAKVMGKNKKGNLNPSDLKYLDRIHSNGTHLLGLINVVLDLSKVEAGKMELELRDVDLGELVQETVGALQGRLLERPVELKHRIPEGLVTLRTDPHKLKQVLINLVGNSLKFTKEGSVTMVVVCDAAGRPLRIDVRDTGIGIPHDKLKAIFDAFQQADNSTQREYGGTGLGLAISGSLCDLMGYHITVRSTVGEGSIFSIQLKPGEHAGE